jgi:hypothetical protein
MFVLNPQGQGETRNYILGYPDIELPLKQGYCLAKLIDYLRPGLLWLPRELPATIRQKIMLFDRSPQFFQQRLYVITHHNLLPTFLKEAVQFLLTNSLPETLTLLPALRTFLFIAHSILFIM